jgi:hypothetical protein
MPLISGLVRVDTLVGLLVDIRINWGLKVRLLALLVSGRSKAAEAAPWYQTEKESWLTNRRLACILHHRLDSIRTLSNIRYETTSWRLPLARSPHFRLLILVQVVQDEKWVLPIRTFVLGKRR